MMSTLPLASAGLSNLLDGALCKNVFYFHIFSFFWFSNVIFQTLILPLYQLQTQQVMTSQIMSHIEYLIHTYCAHFVVETDEKSSHNGEFQYDLMMISDSGLLFWATLYMYMYIREVPNRTNETCLDCVAWRRFVHIRRKYRIYCHCQGSHRKWIPRISASRSCKNSGKTCRDIGQLSEANNSDLQTEPTRSFVEHGAAGLAVLCA